MSVKKCTVSIAGTTYSLRIDEAEQDVLKAAQELELLIQNMCKKSNGPIDKDKVILIALQIAVERLQLQNRLDQIESKLTPMISDIASELTE